MDRPVDHAVASEALVLRSDEAEPDPARDQRDDRLRGVGLHRDLHAEARVAAEREHGVVDLRGDLPREDHDRLVLEVGERHRIPFGQPVVLRDRHLEARAADAFGPQRGLVQRRVHDPDVDVAPHQRLLLFGRGELADHEADAGQRAPELRHHLGQHDEQRRGGDPDGQLADLAAVGASRELGRLIHLPDRLARLGEEHLARPGQRHHALGAVRQPHVELLLQPADLLAHGGLADVAPVGGPVEVQLLGERDEALQRDAVHADSVPVISKADQ